MAPAVAGSGIAAGSGAATGTTIGAGLAAAAHSIGTTIVTTALGAIPGGSAAASLIGLGSGVAGSVATGGGVLAGLFGVGATATGALAGTTAGAVLATTSSVFGALSAIKTIGDLVYSAKTNKSYNYDNCSGEDGWAGITRKKWGTTDAEGKKQSQMMSYSQGQVESWKQKDSGRVINKSDKDGNPITHEKIVQYCADAFNPGRKRTGNTDNFRENNSLKVSKELYDKQFGLNNDNKNNKTPREHTYFADCNQWGVNNGIPNGFCLPKYEDSGSGIGAGIGSILLPGIGTLIGSVVGDGANASKHYCESGKSKLDLTSEYYHDKSGQYLFHHDPASISDDENSLGRVELKN